MNRAGSGSGSGSGSSGNSGFGACAACRFQRRKCGTDCALAPYFPSYRHKDFLNAHRLFGVNNLIKHTKNLDPVHKSLAMQTLIYEANARASDPVGGCYARFQQLRWHLEFLKMEYQVVMDYLHIFRAQANQIEQQQRQQQLHQDYNVELDCTSTIVQVNPELEDVISENVNEILADLDLKQESASFQNFL